MKDGSGIKCVRVSKQIPNLTVTGAFYLHLSLATLGRSCVAHQCSSQSAQSAQSIHHLVGGFNLEKYESSQIGSCPQGAVKIKNDYIQYLEPPPTRSTSSKSCFESNLLKALAVLHQKSLYHNKMPPRVRPCRFTNGWKWLHQIVVQEPCHKCLAETC